MINKGRLRDTPFLKLLMDLYTEKATGILRVTNGAEVKIIYISSGKPIFAASNLPSDRMGALVLRLKLVTEEQLDTALQEVMKTGERLGTVLVNMNVITPEQLYELVLKQVSEIIYSVFEFEDAEYTFIENVQFSNEVITLDLSLWELLIEGVKKKYSPDKLKEIIGTTNTILHKNPAASESTGIIKNTEAEILYNIIDGAKTVGEVIEASNIGELRAIQTLGVLKLLGFITTGVEKKETTSSTSLIKEMKDKLEKFKSMNLFEKLGLDTKATKEQILASFTSLSRNYHPDKFSEPQYKDIKPLAVQIYNQIVEAFTILYKDSTREKYIQELEDQDKSILFAETDPVLARQSYEKGRAYVNEKRYPEAYQMFNTAISNDPNVSEYYTAIGILETMNFDNHPVNIKAAERAFSKAIELNPAEARNYYYLGVIYKNKEDYKTARGYFQKALVHNPNHKESKRQLELLDRIG
jgi:tetratricopeptide (TPR) repeat protein